MFFLPATKLAGSDPVCRAFGPAKRPYGLWSRSRPVLSLVSVCKLLHYRDYFLILHGITDNLVWKTSQKMRSMTCPVEGFYVRFYFQSKKWGKWRAEYRCEKRPCQGH